MPIWSSSEEVTQPRPVAASWRIILLRALRFWAVSFLESLRSENQGFSSDGKMTAPITSGPARGPRPTSSIPRIAIIEIRLRILFLLVLLESLGLLVFLMLGLPRLL